MKLVVDANVVISALITDSTTRELIVTLEPDLLFQYIEVVPANEFHPYIEQAEEAIGDTDPDDVLYVACALARDAGVWSDDSDFDEQDLVPVYSTSEVIDSFDTV